MSNYTATKEKAIVTLGGWDGKSYNGEARTMTVYEHTARHMEGKKFVRTWMPKSKEYAYHLILDEVHPISGVATVQYWASEEK